MPNACSLVKQHFDKGGGSVKLPHCLVTHTPRTHIHISHSLSLSHSLYFLIQIKWQRLFLYSNENINIRHPASQSPSLLASHLNISYLQDISRFESSGLLSPARETTGKSETCHTSRAVMCHERIPFRG